MRDHSIHGNNGPAALGNGNGRDTQIVAEATAVADVLIQAGHEGRIKGRTGAVGPLGREIDWTPVVADEATRILRAAGVSVIRASAFLEGEYHVKMAVFIHFDGSADGSSGASIGYDDPSDKPAADAWKKLYQKYWPWSREKWMSDNFTNNLRHYYGFHFTRTDMAELVLEFGDLNDPEQARWLKPRLKWLGALLAHFISHFIGKGDVPLPDAYDGADTFEGKIDGAPVMAGGIMDPTDNLAERVPFLTKGTKDVAELAISPMMLESIIDQPNLLPAWFLRVGAARARAICKITTSGTSFDGRSGNWMGTGFMVSENILLTNHHVLNSFEVAENGLCVFDYEEEEGGGIRSGRIFRINPSKLFLTSPLQTRMSREALDFTFVWVDGEPGKEFGHIPISREARPIRNGEFANIIQHPGGRPKAVVVQENQVATQNLLTIHYTSDTEPGSSGAPVMTNEWRAVALHHASRPSEQKPGMIENEGIKLSAIAAYLENLSHGDKQREDARKLLGLFDGTDELMGFFGAMGRENRDHETGVEVVVNRYKGEIDDVDIGFWNLEWFVNRFEAKLNDVAKIIVTMNLDIWAFEETGEEATRALVEHLASRYKLDYGCEFSEPGAGRNKQATAVIWNRKTIRGEKREWPEEIDRWFGTNSRDFDDLGLESVDGKIFDRYPGLYYFQTANRAADDKEELDFFLVPLHLKAQKEGSQRRRMAAGIIGAAITKMTEKYNADRDWIIGGDFNATLASRDFQKLLDGRMLALSAKDEEGGAFSYVKSPRSLIDHIFISPNMANIAGAEDYFIVAHDKEFPDYLKRVSDHRPVLVRLSLQNRKASKPSLSGKVSTPAAEIIELREILRDVTG